MQIRAAMSLITPLAFAVYALAIHAEEVKNPAPADDAAVQGTYQRYLGRSADSGNATEAKPAPKPSGGGGKGHVKPFDGATGAQAGGKSGKKRWDMVENKGGVQQDGASAPNKAGWDQKKGQGGIANPEPKPDEAMLLPAVQASREAASRAK